MANFQIPPPNPLNLADGTAATNWRIWKAAWSNYTLATKLDKEDEERQVATLLAVIGNDANKVFRTFTWANPDDAKKINSVLQKFEDHCIPRQNIIYERFKFFTRQQSTTETVDQYLTDLRQIAANCDWESLTPDQLLRDRVVTGISNSTVRARLLREKKLTLEKALNHVRAVECTETQMKEMSLESSVQAVQFKPQRARPPQCGRNRSGDTPMNRGKKKNARPTAENNSRLSDTVKDCKYCGREHKKGKCPAYGQTCRNCHGTNHFAAKCSAKNRVSTIQEKFHLGAARFAGQQERKMVTLTLLNVANNGVGQEVTFLMDTGAECNVLPASVYRRVTGDESLQQLHRYGNSVLILANGYEQPIEGKATIQTQRAGNQHAIEVNVVQGQGYEPILGKQTLLDMNMIQILDCDREPRVSRLSANEAPAPLLEEYSDVFEGLGKLEGPYNIVTDPSVNPVVHPPRRLPVALIDQVQAKLDSMVTEGIIEKVDQPTDWVSSMLVVHKPPTGVNGETKLRICLDPKDLNKAIKREHFPMPTIEEIATRLNGAKIFSVFDASNGFWQIELDEKSSLLTTFNTPFGRFKWKRMPFGISSAPEIWQRRMYEHIEGLKGVEVIADDFLVVGYGDTPEEWKADHDRNVRAFLDRCRQRNLKLNREKARLQQTEVRFVGHLLTPEGLKPDPRKVEAIVKMPEPTDASSLRRYLGMVNYLAKFLPRLSDETEVLRRLLDKDAEWCWLPAHAKAVSRIKAMMITAPVLAYYNVKKPVTIQCDASQSGLGAALLQDGCPVAYCSRAMTQTEQNYAQIEKELLAVVFACEKFNHYIYARKNVAVESDHKPLETIFKKPIHSSPKRLQRMRLRLQNYDLKVEYKRGTSLYLADTLSRAYLEHTPPDSDHCEVHAVRESSFASELEQLKHHEDVSVLPRKLEAIRDATAQDEELQILIETIKVGWPTSRSDVKKLSQRKRRVIELYWNSREELTTEDGLVYKGHRIVIPTAERPSTIKSLHESHIGIEGTLRRARDIVYWPGITAALKDYLSKCPTCNRYRPEQPKEPLIPHDVPQVPWEKVGVDLFELQKQEFLIAVDYYSGMFEVQDLQSTTATRVVTILKSWFARHGIPKVVVSDNGPPFGSSAFQSFSEEWDFQHATSSPRYPQSNGRVENAVKTCKSLLTKAKDDKQDPLLALLEWRNTPTEGMDASPAQLFFSRRTRTRLPIAQQLLEPNVIHEARSKIQRRKQKQKRNHDRHARELPPLHRGDAVRMRLPGDVHWTLGRVRRYAGPRSYLVTVNGRTYRRNRRHLRTTTEHVPPDPELELELEPATQAEPAAQPENRLAPDAAPRPQPLHRPIRQRKPPPRFGDFEYY